MNAWKPSQTTPLAASLKIIFYVLCFVDESELDFWKAPVRDGGKDLSF